MATIAEIRSQYPGAYNDMSDKQLADAMYTKHYSDMPRADFDKKVGIGPSTTKVPEKSFMDKYGRTLATTAGGVLGGIAAAPAAAFSAPSIVGPVAIEAAGAGLGAGMGGQAYDIASILMGKNKAQTPQQMAVQAAKDVGYNAISVPGSQVAVKALGMAGKAGGSALATLLGATTGVGPTTIKEAAKAGAAGGTAAKALLENMRGLTSVDEIVPMAKQALGKMRQEKLASYARDIKPISKDPKVLDFSRIEKALVDVKDRGFYKGQSINQKASVALSEIENQIIKWKNLPKNDFHTVEGLDALKKSIGNIQQSLPYGSPARSAADKVYNSIKDEIVTQAPDYARVMKNYEEASTHLKDIESSLSLGKKTATDTSIRKLQSVMKNNVNSGFARRSDLGRELERAGADTLFPAIAGQALSSPIPRGLSGVVTGGLEGAALLSHGINPAALAALPATSPRIVGEAAYYAGKGLKALKPLGRKKLTQAEAYIVANLLANKQQGQTQ
jgi:hypothetical protein